MHRLFVAIRPPAEIRRALIALMGGVAGARWQDDDQLHITLRFIGEVDGRMADDVAAALGAVHCPPLELSVSGVGMFDRKGRVDTLWAGIAPRDAIERLHRKIDQALVRIGLPAEMRAYLPHITLARFGREAGPLDAFNALHGGLSLPPFHAAHFCLYESHMGHTGSSYEIIERYRLG
ncbi:MAG: RNA 2',3'-cyclic phosphodiesterase [Sphingomonas sanxanigenens]|uniref:RNA 2',3'-cyclic phosphodiesterase n=1 Tax=Sphingomonas sanxanigenens TaxID=397260 RepID=A0A2W5C014_9SPHN|nr:MAG: RNA 2',3'-cyclic phosphodiesterase [Sphingomonas sanxanigenens]